jgi:hypothetical protein
MNIKEKYPKVWQMLKEWMKPRLLSFQETLIKSSGAVEIPELSDDILDKFVEVTVQSNIRILYDFLDDNKIRVFPEWILPTKDDEDQESQWTYSINEEILFPYFKTRTKAELAGFEEALKQLNEK